MCLFQGSWNSRSASSRLCLEPLGTMEFLRSLHQNQGKPAKCTGIVMFEYLDCSTRELQAKLTFGLQVVISTTDYDFSMWDLVTKQTDSAGKDRGKSFLTSATTLFNTSIWLKLPALHAVRSFVCVVFFFVLCTYFFHVVHSYGT